MSDSAAPLRRDVRLLGTILGNVLVEQEGPELLQSVERIRKRARSARRNGTVADIGELGAAEDGVLVLRAFGLYFQLANLAEQLHRLRRRREDARHGDIARESLADVFGRLGDADLERARDVSIRQVILEEELLPEKKLDEILNLKKLTQGGRA